MESSIVEQYQALHADTVFVPLGERTVIELTGKDRVSFLHNLCTNDIKKLEVGHGCEAFFTDVRGKILCHTLLFAESDRHVIATAPNHADVLAPHLDKYLIREDVQINDRSTELAEILLAGPTTEARLQAQGVAAPAGMLCCSVATLADAEVMLIRVPLATVPAFVLRCARDKGPQLEAHLAEQGVVRAGDELAEVARIEAGFPRSGRDVTQENLPQEVNRDATAISFTKGCYLGQETVARIDALGHVNKQLVRLSFAGDSVPPDGTKLAQNGKDVGRVTSACMSPQNESPIALAYVRSEAIAGGEAMQSDFGVATITA